MTENPTENGDIAKAQADAQRVAASAGWLKSSPAKPAAPKATFNYTITDSAHNEMGERAAARADESPDHPRFSRPGQLVAATPLTLVKHEGLDPALRAARASAEQEVTQQLQQAYATNDQPSIDRLKQVLRDLKSATSPEGIAAAIAAATSAAAAEAGGEKVETPAAKAERLWNEIKAVDKKLDRNIDELHKEGLISDKEYEKLKKEREGLDKLSQDDPARIKGEQTYQAHLEKVYKQADEAAPSTGEAREKVEEGKGLVKVRHEKVAEQVALREKTMPQLDFFDAPKLPIKHVDNGQDVVPAAIKHNGGARTID